MKHILFILLLFIWASAFGQTPIFTAGLTYCNGAPAYNPGNTGSRYAVDTVNWELYTRTVTNNWIKVGDWLQSISGCAAPAYTPTKYQSVFVVNACSPPELYYYTGSGWEQIGGGSGGITGTGLAGRVAVWDGASALTYDVNFVYDTVNNELGVRTADPTRTFDVNGEARVRDLNTDTPTRLVGADADGDLGDAGSGTANQLTLWSGTGQVTGNAGFTYRILHRALELGATSANGNNRARLVVGGTDTVFNAASARFHSMNIGNSIRTSNTGQTISYLNLGSLFGTTSTINVDHNNTNLRLFQLTAPTVTIGGGVTGTSATGLATITGSSSFSAALRVEGNGANNALYAENSNTVHSLFHSGTALDLVVQNLSCNPGSNGIALSMQRFQNLRAGATGNGIGIAYLLSPTSGGALSTDFQVIANNATAGNFSTNFKFNAYSANSKTTHLIVGSNGIYVNRDAQPTSTIHARGSGATSATSSLDVENSNDSTILLVRNDRRVGINTATPDVSLDAGDNTDAIKIPAGNTGSRPSVNNTIRINTEVEGLEVRENGNWYRLTSSKTPTFAAGAGAGTGALVGASGSDLAGSVSLVTGTGTAAGVLVTVTYGSPLAINSNFYVTFSCRNANCTGLQLYISAESQSSFTISSNNAPAASTIYDFNYHVGQ